MAYLKQRLETLLGHHVYLMTDTHPEGWTRWEEDVVEPNWAGWLVEIGEDYIGIEYSGDALYLLPIAHVKHIQHNPHFCSTCP